MVSFPELIDEIENVCGGIILISFYKQNFNFLKIIQYGFENFKLWGYGRGSLILITDDY